MDFSLTDEQQMIIKTTNDFVVNELYPHENEIEETGVLRPELRDELKAKAIEAGLFAANMPAEVGGAGLDTLTWVSLRKGTGPRQLRPALDLRGTSLQHPHGLQCRTAREVSVSRRSRRNRRLPCHDRTRRRLGPSRHEDLRQAGWRLIRHQRHQTLHQPRR